MKAGFPLSFLLTIFSIACIFGRTLPSWQTVLVENDDLVISFTQWNVSSADMVETANTTNPINYYNLSAQVPGDLMTDLMRAGIIQDPYYGRNFLTQHVWMGPSRPNESQHQRSRTWIYSTYFTLPDNFNNTLFLVAESIKMGARIELNGVVVGMATNQFRRYILQLTQQALQQRASFANSRLRRHELNIIFDPEISTNGRFMACSGGWDWAPYVSFGC
jgi:hypothetical protein